MNVFLNENIAASYDAYYITETGKKIDELEKAAISELLKNCERQKMLELGCGTGHWTEFFVKEGFKVTAIDISEAMLKVAKKKNLVNACFYKLDASNLAFPDESFEVVASITMLEFSESPGKIIDEIFRVLKPGGWVILGCLNRASILGKNKNQDEVFKNAHFFDTEEITRFLHNFYQIEIRECVKMSDDFQILDGSDKENNTSGVFLSVKAQKKL